MDPQDRNKSDGYPGDDFRLADPAVQLEEAEMEVSLRPRQFGDFVGQEGIKEQLKIFIEAAQGRREALDHVLLVGPPGLGKTTLAGIIASEMGVSIRTTSGPALERKADIAAILTNLEEGDILFIDEIHRLGRSIEEVLYPAMEDYQLDIVIGQGPSARTIRLDVPPFTMVGATTRAGLITTPLRDRFGVTHRLDYYNTDELSKIAARSAAILGVEVEEDGLHEIAGCSRGTPRVCNRLLKRVRDYAQVRHDGCITDEVARRALGLLEVDSEGLDKVDREILRLIIEKFDGGPVGLGTLAVAVGEERDTIEDVYEPYLLKRGLLMRTPRGRVVTRLAYEHLAVDAPAEERNEKLF